MLDLSIRTRLGALDLDVAFAAPPGVTALFGASGAGKTSLLRCMAGLNRSMQGHIRIGDTDLARLKTAQRRVGYVFQDARLFPHMTVAQNLTYGGRHDHDRIVDLLGLAPLLSRRPATLSGGEAQRVAIGRALMCDPAILLLDEPLASLDAPRKAEIIPYLIALRDSARIPILYVSHDLSEVAQLATTLVVLVAGRVVQSGPLIDLLSDPALTPHLGPRAAGSVLPATVASYDASDDMTALTLSGGTLLVPGRHGAPGQGLRLRVLAQDIILSLTAPTGLSALNVLPVTVERVLTGEGGTHVVLRLGRDRLLARITARSARRLDLTPDQPLFAIIKATALISA